MPRNYIQTPAFDPQTSSVSLGNSLKYFAKITYLLIFLFRFGGLLNINTLFSTLVAFSIQDRILFGLSCVMAVVIGIPLAYTLLVILHELAHWIVLSLAGYKVTLKFNWATLPPTAYVATFDQLQWKESFMPSLLAPLYILTPIFLILLWHVDNILLFIYIAEMFAKNIEGSRVDISAFIWFWKKPKKTCTLLTRERKTYTFEPKT